MYSAKDVAQIAGVQESRVRYWAQTGLVGPSATRGGRPIYTFPDVVAVKMAKELLDRGLTLQRVRKNLEALKQQLPGVDRPLAQLRIVSDGERLIVVDADTRFEPLTGQLLLNFALAPLEADVHKLAVAPKGEAAARPREESAYACFLEGTRLDEEGKSDEALLAFGQALDGDPGLAAAHTNLGSLYWRSGRADEARAAFEAALALDPEQPEARYNLANLCAEAGDRERAVAEWTRVVSACPEFADAHFNLGVLFADEGSPARARTHLQAYLQLDPESEWAERARALLEELSPDARP